MVEKAISGWTVDADGGDGASAAGAAGAAAFCGGGADLVSDMVQAPRGGGEARQRVWTGSGAGRMSRRLAGDDVAARAMTP